MVSFNFFLLKTDTALDFPVQRIGRLKFIPHKCNFGTVSLYFSDQ